MTSEYFLKNWNNMAPEPKDNISAVLIDKNHSPVFVFVLSILSKTI